MRFDSGDRVHDQGRPEEAHQQWLVANEERLAKAHPEGTRYIGTFSVVFSSEKNAGFDRSFVELDSYAALDRLAAAGKDPSSELHEMLRGWMHSVTGPECAWSNGLYKAVVDATIWDPPTD